jgi:phosphomannomutase
MNELKTPKFGTGGWRAIIGDDFTKANVELLMTALALKMKAEGVHHHGFVIGYDRRFLSKEAAEWAAGVMAAHDIKTWLINREAPTPMIMFTVTYYDTRYGMSVTASHNPALYNGIKIFTAGGRDADESVTADIESYIERVNLENVRAMDLEDGIAIGVIEKINPQNIYVDSILRSINNDAIRAQELKVALDPMYGVSKTSLHTILLTCRCDVDVIHDRHDTLFGGRLPAPTADTLNALTNYVLENDCHIGIATDGDADRIGVIDERGQFLHPNRILALLYYYLLKYRHWNGPAVRHICTTPVLDRIAAGFGQQCYEVPVGFKHISAKMAEANAVIGGESSGGLTVRGHIKGKDGIYAAALLVEMMAVTRMKLSEISAEIARQYGDAYMTEYGTRFTQEDKVKIMTTLLTDKKLPEFPYEVEKVSYLDGCKVYFKNGGWMSARFSGTEPLMRIFCEMETEEMAREVQGVVTRFLGLK